MQLIETVTVGSGGAASIEFTGIPQDGTDLLLVMSVRGNFFGNFPLEINGSTINFSSRQLIGTGSSVSSTSRSDNIVSDVVTSAGNTANTFSSMSFYFANYTNSSNKSISVDAVQENNATASTQNITAMLWSNSSAITSIGTDVISFGGLYVEHSTFSLYKITKA
jgi:hypothetical protein